jgi:NitT/TauT family transport system ATP-binding protein
MWMGGDMPSSAERKAIVSFERVSLTLGGDAIYADLSFEVREGEFLCILGPSGCGKSTSLRLMGDLLPMQGGTIRVAGKPPADSWKALAYVFQSPRLVPWRTALGNVALGMELRHDRPDKAAMKATASRLLDLVGLAKDAGKYPAMLSGGERQRVAIARALAVEPRIILMDEPFSALDLNTRRRLRTEIVSIWQKTGKTVVFVTHDIEEALVLADRIILLSNKPTRVLETLELDAPRPRDVAMNPGLQAHRARLHDLFTQLEDAAPAAA